uniref:ATP synthase F0 subunit 8 n=1 Tax=Neoscona nautica TaxID=258338 RepID=A0A140AU42_9ARAC|nr:ATP synthase F0 subunit 8 [Neoscona nautica]ALF63149.1 ATP synthase F0 subunit 8 [Neoscona nautica]
MPQLMPLNWIFSSMMLLIIIMSASIIYSEKMMKTEINMLMNNMKNSENMWCW